MLHHLPKPAKLSAQIVATVCPESYNGLPR